MKYSLFFLSLSLSVSFAIYSQNIKVQPYLQDATPNSIYILWETDSGEESTVEWGLSPALGNTTVGTATPSDGSSRIHEVQLENLERFTKYYYRVITGSATSEVFSFKTPPFPTDNESFRIVAMSDMQRDGSHPDKFQEIVEEGVIQYLEDEIGGDITDNLALVMIPGDLVVTGTNYSQWENHFFNPGQALFSNIPLYPVLGNHEADSPFYFAYFKLPDNGSAGFEEHWWYKDYGNVRIIGLDSNSPYDNDTQLNWMDGVLSDACNNNDIDFVFAQLHHPFKSELWTPGEKDYTGEVITKLETFTNDCGKPSIHFFGHTHGYSRGQSRDHKHLWVNVATAGGAIDNWGEFPNFDYDEFSVSQDEYGFVVMEVTDGADPKFTLKRIGRGDQDVIENNVVRDSLVVRRAASPVNTPTGIFPKNITVSPDCVVLRATDFSSSNSDALHGQSHWQVTDIENDFSNPVKESWKNYENWYFDTDTQQNDNLFDEAVTDLAEFETYWWRVRYRDREMNWSDWSEPVSFDTSESQEVNLLLNGGAEEQLTHWQIIQGEVEALTAGECNGVNPNSGDYYFAVGGLCDHSEIGIAHQNVSVTEYASEIDQGGFNANFGGYLSNFNGSDLPEMRLLFLDDTNTELGTSETLSTQNSFWTYLELATEIPIGTRSITFELKGTRNAGTDNDSYFDDLFLYLGDAAECEVLGITKYEIRKLQVIPNPISKDTNTVRIPIPEVSTNDLLFQIANTKGQKIILEYSIENDTIVFKKDHMASGIYIFYVRSSKKLIGTGKFIVK